MSSIVRAIKKLLSRKEKVVEQKKEKKEKLEKNAIKSSQLREAAFNGTLCRVSYNTVASPMYPIILDLLTICTNVLMSRPSRSVKLSMQTVVCLTIVRAMPTETDCLTARVQCQCKRRLSP